MITNPQLLYDAYDFELKGDIPLTPEEIDGRGSLSVLRSHLTEAQRYAQIEHLENKGLETVRHAQTLLVETRELFPKSKRKHNGVFDGGGDEKAEAVKKYSDERERRYNAERAARISAKGAR